MTDKVESSEGIFTTMMDKKIGVEKTGKIWMIQLSFDN